MGTDSMTPTDSAEKVVAEWRDAMEGVTPGPWRPSRYGFQVVSDYPEPAWQSVVELTTIARSEPNVEREMLAQKTIANWLARCSPSGISGLLALIESQRATIERVEREKDEAWREADKRLTTIDDLNADAGAWHRRAEAAEARVTALEAEKAGLNELVGWAYDTLIEINVLNYDHDDVCKLNAASVDVILGLATVAEPRLCNAQALSRSSTEVKNDGA